MEASSPAHRLHLTEHALTSEASAKATPKEVVIVVEHPERVPPSLLTIVAACSLLLHATPHGREPSKGVIVEEILEWITPAEELPEDFVGLGKAEAAASAPTTEPASEEVRVSKAASSSASAGVEALLAVLVVDLPLF